jgi:hypothetical protein
MADKINMETQLSLAQFIVSTLAILMATGFGLIKYIDYKTGLAEERLRAEIGEIRLAQGNTQTELRKISDSIIEIKTLLLGVKGTKGLIQKLEEQD